MSARLVLLASLLVITPAFSQMGNMTRVNQRYAAHDQNVHPEAAPQLDQRAILLHEINQDSQELSALSLSLKTDLEQLQKGFLAKDLSQKLKKIEKLSKRLRQEMAQAN